MLIASVWASTTAWLWYRTDQVRHQQRSELATLAHIFAVQAERNIASADRLLALIIPRLSTEGGNPERIHRLLRLAVQGLANVRGALVLDRNGASIGDASSVEPRPFNANDRDFFREHLNDPHLGIQVGVPVRSRLDGKWTITLSRRLNGPNNDFLGVIVLGVDPEFFGQTFDAAAALEASTIAMVGRHGHVLARHPIDDAWLGRQVGYLTVGPRGIFEAVSPIDGVARWMAYERATADQVSVVVGRDARLIPMEVWGEAVLSALVASLVSLLLLLGHRMFVRNSYVTQAALTRFEAARDAAVEEQWRFVSVASHEFRTPLAIIDGAAQRLEELARENAAAGRKIERIRSSVLRMTSIIDRTLSSANVVDGKVELELKPLDLGELLHASAARTMHASPDFEVHVDAATGVALIEADEKRLDQVFSNLMANAVKFSGRSRRIEVSLGGTDRYWKVTVRDFGIGIRPEDVSKLFTRFFRGQNAVGISGTGIGLHLVHELVRMHDGRVFVQSEAGAGATFVVMLPRQITASRINSAAE